MEEMEVKTTEFDPITEDTEVGTEVVKTEGRSFLGLGMLIGSGLTLAAIVGGRKLKTMWYEHRAKKEPPEVEAEVIVEDSEEDLEDEDPEDDGD